MGLAPAPLLLGLGPQELWILLAVVVLIFGAKKLPELARGSGQALRIFKAETKELKEADKAQQSDPAATATPAAFRLERSKPPDVASTWWICPDAWACCRGLRGSARSGICGAL